jgi:hypothetical protein
MNNSENLQGLENLLCEFFSAGASNERKREIEKMLESFLQQEEAWKECLFFLDKSSNPYVCMFSLTSLEKVNKLASMQCYGSGFIGFGSGSRISSESETRVLMTKN